MSINGIGRSCSHELTRQHLSAIYNKETGLINAGCSALKNTSYFIVRLIARIFVVACRFFNIFLSLIKCAEEGNWNPLKKACKLFGLSVARLPLGVVQIIGGICGAIGQSWSTEGTKLSLLMHEFDNYLDQYEASLDSDYEEEYPPDSTVTQNQYLSFIYR